MFPVAILLRYVYKITLNESHLNFELPINSTQHVTRRGLERQFRSSVSKDTREGRGQIGQSGDASLFTDRQHCIWGATGVMKSFINGPQSSI